jgi:PAS domain S-box-containing protein
MADIDGGGLASARADLARRQKRSFGVIAGLFIGLLVVSLVTSWAAITLVNGTRAYATGEGRYSKAQKTAVMSLYRYAHSGADADYQAFLAAMEVPGGDRDARQALEAPTPDLAGARDGFIRGENHADDIESLITLFRLFRHWQPFAAAVADWHEGDARVGELVDLGAELKRRVGDGTLDDAERARLLAVIERLDDHLTALENIFSNDMGEAARDATRLVVLGLGTMMILLWAIGMAYAARLLRRQLALGRRLGASEQRFRDYAEVASDWYWETDAENRIVFLSERFFAVAGATAQAALGQLADDFIAAHAADQAARREVAVFTQRRAFRDLHLRFTRSDGSLGYWSLAGKPQHDPAGNFLGYRGIGADISAAVNDALALRHAKDKAEAASRAKSEFLANMSHELRTPLNAILGFSEIIMDRLFGPEASDRYTGYAGDIHASGQHLLAIIDDILDLAKIEAGRNQLDESVVSVTEIIDAAQRLLADRFERAGLNLQVELPDALPLLQADRRKLKQALLNLLSNALKFTPRGGTVTLAALTDAAERFGIAVRDTGIGIRAGDIETALSPFGQVESVFSRAHHGTGLGLPLARSLIELHGGALSLASEPGIGTVVTLWLPAARVIDPGLAGS